METNKRIYTAAILFTLALMTACNRTPEDALSAKEETPVVGDKREMVTLSEAQYKAISIRLGTLTTTKIATSLQANGILDVPPQNLVTISAPMGGFVKETKLLQGMRVRKGEVIAVLEHQDYIQLQQDYLDNVSSLQYLETEYKRQEELSKENINSQKSFQLAKSNYERARAQAEGLKAKLKMLNIDPAALTPSEISSQIKIYSPLPGFVTEVNVNIGSFVNNTDPMFRIVDVKHLHAELQVYEKDIHKVKIGQKVNFHLPGESTARTASVFLVGKEISADRTVRIHCHLDEEDENLLPGMYVSGTIQIASADVPAINVSAIVSVDGQQAVFVKRGARDFELVKIKSGTRADDLAEVQEGSYLQPGDSIVLDGSFELLGLLKNMENE